MTLHNYETKHDIANVLDSYFVNIGKRKIATKIKLTKTSNNSGTNMLLI